MTALVSGGNAPVANGALRVDINYSPVPGADIDVSSFVLNAAGKVRSDSDMCFCGKTSVLAGAVQMAESSVGRAMFTLDLSRLEPGVEKVALTATIHENKASFDRVSRLSLAITGGIEVQIPTRGMKETALILGEFYRRQGAWKFRCVAQGFAGGLEPLARHFGVDVSAPAPTPAPTAPTPVPPVAAVPPQPVPAKPSIVLSKITLDKTRSSISLEKTAFGFGEIKVNLNWNQRCPGGFFARTQPIDLDVGCLFELANGHKGVVQALGNAFGDIEHEPYIELMGDDRTGSVEGGEWLHINGKRWSEIRRILIFAFIYEGAPNWKETGGIGTVRIPGQPDIEVRLNEEGGRYGMCAIAMLENDGGAVRVSRKVDFHTGHRDMDKAYGWGMRWSTGSK